MNPPAGNSESHFLVTNFKVHEKNTLRGFMSLTLPSGMVIHGCGLHRRLDAQWIQLPAKEYKKRDGSIGYSPLVEFNSPEARRRFDTAASEAVDRFMADGDIEFTPPMNERSSVKQ
jgi:hypothetical protein